jgi:magnesium chelatase subunit D
MTSRTPSERSKGKSKIKDVPKGSPQPATVYPFSAIVGQDEMKLALILNVIDPSIGGALLMGHRGTGKSTTVRALAELLSRIFVVRGCPYNCDPNDQARLCKDCAELLAATGQLPREKVPVPVIDLPLGATEDRVCGSIDIERALKHGIKAFEPGLLARANRGFLYIDEVNLLEDHLVDLLLDVAVTGRNQVERENISVEHAASFVLIGSGNPEEGELRPQLLDRFGLFVEVRTENDIDHRVAIVEQRDAFERQPEAFREGEKPKLEQLRRRVERARSSFGAVKVEPGTLRQIAELCSELKVDGHRGELTIMRAARALAAFSGRKRVSEEDVRRVSTLALRHRLHRDPLAETAGSSRVEEALDKVFQTARASTADHSSAAPRGGSPAKASRNAEGRNGSESDAAIKAPPAVDAKIPKLAVADSAIVRRVKKIPSAGRQPSLSRSVFNNRRGRYARAVTTKTVGASIALLATLRAALVNGSDMRSDNLRYKQFADKNGRLFVFVIDTSGSMARNRINQAKGALVRLLAQSYVNRDSVAIVSFKGTSAEVVLSPTRSIIRARRSLDFLTMGGGTPLCAGLSCAFDLASREKLRSRRAIQLLVFTDGNANVPLSGNGFTDRIRRQRAIKIELQHLGAEFERSGVSVAVIDTRRWPEGDDDPGGLAATLRASLLRLDPQPEQLLP